MENAAVSVREQACGFLFRTDFKKESIAARHAGFKSRRGGVPEVLRIKKTQTDKSELKKGEQHVRKPQSIQNFSRRTRSNG